MGEWGPTNISSSSNISNITNNVVFNDKKDINFKDLTTNYA
jgi:hypothetical protein